MPRKLVLPLVWLACMPAGPVCAGALDLNGYWQPLIMEDFKLRTEGVKREVYNGIELNDAARAAADGYRADAGADELFFDRCGPHGAPRIMYTDTRLHITQDDDEITMELEAEGQTRRFYLDEREWPGGELPWQGHSVVYQDGSSLLTVITRHMRPGLLRDNGVPYSGEAVLTEHYTRHGDYFTVITVLEDPKYLKSPFITSTSFRKLADAPDWKMGSCRE